MNFIYRKYQKLTSQLAVFHVVLPYFLLPVSLGVVLLLVEFGVVFDVVFGDVVGPGSILKTSQR